MRSAAGGLLVRRPPADLGHAWCCTAVIVLQPNLPQHLNGREVTQVPRTLVTPEPRHECIAVRIDLERQSIAFTRLFGESRHVSPWAIALIPRKRHALTYPVGVALAELVQGITHRFLHTFQVIQPTDRGHDIGGIGPLGATRFDPPTAFAGGEEGIEQPLDGFMGQQALVIIV